MTTNLETLSKRAHSSPAFASPILFFLGFFLFMFTRRSEIFPTMQIAIVIAPIFILRFIRIQPAKNGILLTLLGFLLSMNIALWGLFDINDASMILVLNIVRSSLLGILYFLPYMLDRLIYQQLATRAFLSTLVFPTAATAMLFLSSLEGPFDGTDTISIYAYGPLVLQQLNSVVGLWGFIFIYSWLASLINYAWETGFEWGKSKKVVLVFASIVLVVVSFGALKISPLMSPSSETVRIASIVLKPEDGQPRSMQTIFVNRLTSPFDETVSRIENLIRRAAQNDAKIVSFQEFAMTIEKENEETLREAYKDFAKENGVYLSITYAFFSEDEKGENKHLLIDDQGEIRIDYTKRYLWGIGDLGETGVFRKGPEVIQSINTPYGKIAISTCRDMNFQFYIRQAGQSNVDIMLSPSYDFPRSTSPSYRLRAIENGFSFVRPTYNGISYAEDFNGRILARMDFDETSNEIMYADVPTKGVETVYARIGDFLGWVCVAGLLGFSVGALVNRKRLLG